MQRFLSTIVSVMALSGVVRGQGLPVEDQAAIAAGERCTWAIFPPEPTSADWLLITVSGEWGDSCVPDVSGVIVAGNNIIFMLDDVDSQPCSYCAQVITCCVDLAELLAPLPAGSYTLYELVDPYCFHSYPRPVMTFTVAEPPTVPDMDSDGDVDWDDIRPFVDCMTGPEGGMLSGCDNGDVDHDDDVDLRDFQGFQVYFGSVSSPGPRLDGHWNSGCLQGARDRGPACGDVFEFTVLGSTLHVRHFVEYNCCLDGDIEVSLSVTGNVLRFAEYALELPCFCLCPYLVEATVVNLSPGPYVVEYCWQEGCCMEGILVPR